MKRVVGILFTLAIAGIGIFFAKLPLLDRLGPMVISILLAVIYRQIAGYPEKIREGIHFSGKNILRYAIILFGFKLNIDIILHNGLLLLARDVVTIGIAIVTIVGIGKLLKAEKMLTFLLGIGTGVCGAAAIAAVSPILKAEEEDTAIGVGLVALVGTVFAVVYTLLYPLLHITATRYGIWAGTSLHEIAHVAAATAPAGSAALAIGLLAKLGRVLLLVPLSIGIVVYKKIKGTHSEGAKIEFPWFLLGFVATSIIGSYWLAPHYPGVLHHIANVSDVLLTMAMVGLGLNVHLKTIGTKALKPLIAMIGGSVIVSVVMFFLS